MSERFVRIIPLSEGGDGLRLRVEHEDEDLLQIFEERALPEKLMDPNARAVRHIRRFILSDDEGRAVRDALIALYGGP